jgi:phospholipid/cholesterol/gamma-HCH transport system substrate-binding protein
MPSQQEVKWSQLKVGLIVLGSVILLSTLLFLMTSASGLSFFSRKLTVYTYFDNSNGLKTGAPVNLEGVTIGEVKKVQVVTDPARKLTPIRVEMKLNPNFNSSVRTDTLAALATVGVLGDTVVDLDSKTATGPPISDGAELHPTETPSIQDVVKASQGTIESVNLILAKLDRIIEGLQNGEGSAGKLIKDPMLYNQTASTLQELHTLATNLNSGRGTVGKLLTDDQLYNRLNDAANKLDTVATNLSDGKGSAGKLLKDDTLYNNLNETVTNANELISQINHGKGSLGKLAHDPEFAKKLDDTITKLDSILTSVDKGEGSIGQLLKNKSLYDHADATMDETQKLVKSIREDPKKYLVIHMKVF